ncbi:hypothetical protein [Actinoalloteichus spitiensis]|uniref:hypothetical protein n=1 Tax=Actinoalloteichus spitiensis TaxID=252394 RepID=UPI0012F65F5B|nr:hypothetical protein [Actinoalloteichus spitiensis]
MTGWTPETDELGALLAGTAERARARFHRRNGRLGASSTVHAVRLQRWVGGVEVPAPACHVGSGTWDFTTFHPTGDGVTCRRCRRSGAVGATELVSRSPRQLSFDDAEDALF